MSRPSFEQWAMEIAKAVATRSPDPKLKVGCVFVSHDYRRILGCGYNGSIVGQLNTRLSMESGKSGYLHAEVNCLLNNQGGTESGRLFVTEAPCEDCARVIANSRKITSVYYNENQHDNKGIELLKDCGIPCNRLV